MMININTMMDTFDLTHSKVLFVFVGAVVAVVAVVTVYNCLRLSATVCATLIKL